ncbi:NUDIX hydrolase [Shimia sagamensis]|uniref:8-oxo-dGTP diphosphatase n=1 Tax=Shimia sagamensis TaxID=1566352 RepID=A0ABY1NZF2_9RHOB|nr:NUDIX hydrolase [Shimia sagamensis]SMP22679.1 8-oxo-dGTP diphosphatase [Shimia sagamensis]
MQDTEAFHGAKLALLTGGRLVSILRDNDPEIPYPDMWDLPGGGREGSESPEACVLRELKEELALSLDAADLLWKRQYVSDLDGKSTTWFFVAELPDLDINRIRLGDEGQAWRMLDVGRFLRMSNVVPMMQDRLGDYMTERVDA